MDIDFVCNAVETEIARITQVELVNIIRTFMVAPKLEMRSWDYGTEDQMFPCWVVLDHPPSNTVICHCLEGFAPTYPWGLLSRSPEANMGMDCQWYSTLEDAVRQSCMWNGPNPEGYEVV